MSEDKVIDHYGHGDLRDKLAAALAAAGLADERLTPADLAPLDQFHTRGMAATIELGEALAIKPGASVIDIGSGLGGPSRYLATKFGCTVKGIDLSSAFVSAASYLAERAGLAGKVSYDCDNALSLPCPDQSFDIAWTQHVAMNIADRARLYREIRRVLKPGGRFATFDVVANGSELHYPVPWGRTLATSFLLTADATHEAIEKAGFRTLAWQDDTEAAKAWITQLRASGPPPSPNLSVVMGPDFAQLSTNLGRNLLEGRLGILTAVFEAAPTKTRIHTENR